MFGATAKELERVGKTGWKAWIKEQIHPDDAIAKEGSTRIGSHCMRIKYEFEAVRLPGTDHRVQARRHCLCDGKFRFLNSPILK
jgi:hypothetical protein